MENPIKQGEALFGEGKIEEAEKCFLEILNQDSQNKEVYNDLGVIAYQRQDFEQATNYLVRSLEIDPFYKDAVINLSNVLRTLNQLHEAVSFLEKITERYPEDTEILRILENARSLVQVRPKIAVLCLPGLDSFLGDIVNFLGTSYEVQTCYGSNDQEIESTIRWADIIWLEWANELAIALTNHATLLGGKRVICRLHSYEALAGYAGRIKWEKISDLIFVAEHIKNIVLQQIPDLLERVNNVHVVPNSVNLDRFPFKYRAKGKNLAYLGHINHKKGPMLLLHAFRELVREDDNYKLFIGGDFQDPRYELYFNQMIRELDLKNKVFLNGWINDVGSWLEDKNYIINTSVLEGHPVGLMEAMACGLKPVIHNFVGAKGIYPQEYIWNSIPEFVEKIIESDYNPKKYRKLIEERFGLSRQLESIAKILPPRNPDSPQGDVAPKALVEFSNQESRYSIPLPAETYDPAPAIRWKANLKLAQEFLEKGDLEKAEVLVSRSLLQCNYQDDNTLNLFVDVNAKLKDFQKIREAYKRRAINEANDGKLDTALGFFELSINAALFLSGVYDTPVDLEITNQIRTIAKSLGDNFPPFAPPETVRKGSKINLGYLVEGFDSSQAPIKNYINYARFHDKGIFQITFYSRWRPDDEIKGAQNYRKTIKEIENEGHCVVVSPPLPTHLERILFLFQKIKDDKIDILSTNALYTVPHIHLLCAMKPAPFLMKDVMQQPEFSLLPDLTIHHSFHTLIEDVGRCECFGSRYLKPSVTKKVNKSNLRLPSDSVLLTSSGRGQKFISPDFWHCIDCILSNCPRAYFMAIGFSERDTDLSHVLSPEVRKRTILTGFRDDVYDLLQAADIYIDTFPQGGGYSLAEAIFAGLPCVMFESNYWCSFGVKDSTYSEILGIPELIVPKNDYDALIGLVTKLVDDSAYRKRVARLVEARAKNTLGNYDEYIRARESIMIETFSKKVRTEEQLHKYYVRLEKAICRNLNS
ncbi:MAG: glycosyltransferase [Deltaproteobacteria bacterium]|nr:glycosyltransferase [Deltaproteobacteria bacterium]